MIQTEYQARWPSTYTEFTKLADGGFTATILCEPSSTPNTTLTSFWWDVYVSTVRSWIFDPWRIPAAGSQLLLNGVVIIEDMSTSYRTSSNGMPYWSLTVPATDPGDTSFEFTLETTGVNLFEPDRNYLLPGGSPVAGQHSTIELYFKYLAPYIAGSPNPPLAQDLVWDGNVPGYDYVWFGSRPSFTGTLADGFYTTVGYEIDWPGPDPPAETDGNTVMYLWKVTGRGPVLLDSQVLYAGLPHYESFGYNDQGFVVYGKGSFLYLASMTGSVLNITEVDTGIAGIDCSTVRVSQDSTQMMALSFSEDFTVTTWNFFLPDGTFESSVPKEPDVGTEVGYPARYRIFTFNSEWMLVSLIDGETVNNWMWLDSDSVPDTIYPPKYIGCGINGIAMVSQGYYDGTPGEILYTKYDCSGDHLRMVGGNGYDWQVFATDWYSDPEWSWATISPAISSWKGQLAIVPYTFSTPG